MAELDADGDGHSNEVEILGGSLPADPASFPRGGGCGAEAMVGRWDTCGYDPRFAYKRLLLDFCGRSPTYDEYEAFGALDREAQMAALHGQLDACVDTDFWLGRDGELWRLAHTKVRPIQAVKQGEDQGVIPLGDYYDDYKIYVYTHTDDRDAREVLTAQYFVEESLFAGPYAKVNEVSGQEVNPNRRAGMLTTRWFLLLNTMFTGIPRTSAATAFREHLGRDIGRMEGLQPAVEEPEDYDQKGVKAPACAVCHTTLDPMTYPFTRYHGLTGNGGYDQRRIQRGYLWEGPRMNEVPEAGVLLGQPVANLVEWAQVAADSEEFAENTVRDFWKLLVGHEPLPNETEEFSGLWRRFREVHGHNIETMLHELIETEAYGAP